MNGCGVSFESYSLIAWHLFSTWLSLIPITLVPGIRAFPWFSRQGRKEMAVLMLATHAYEDLDRLWDVVANAGVKFIGKQTGSIDALVRDGALAPAAVAAIRSLHMQPGVYAQYVASFGSGPDQIVVDLQVDLAPVELWTFTTHPLERNARERVARLLPRLSTAEVIAWLATEYPRGLIAAGLRAVDESRITAERGPQ